MSAGKLLDTASELGMEIKDEVVAVMEEVYVIINFESKLN